MAKKYIPEVSPEARSQLLASLMNSGGSPYKQVIREGVGPSGNVGPASSELVESGPAASKYYDMYKSAYGLLGQPESEAIKQASGPGNLANTTTENMANSYINKYAEMNGGKLPTSEEIGSFIDKNMTREMAMRAITGKITPDQIGVLAQSHIAANAPEYQGEDYQAPASAPGMSAAQREAGLAQKMEELYGGVQRAGEQQIESKYIPLKEKAVAEEAALGRLRSPVSIPRISGMDAAKEAEKTALYGQVAGARAGEESGLAKLLAQIGSQEQMTGNQQNLERWRAGETLGLQRYLGNQDVDLKNRTLSESINQASLENALKGREIDTAQSMWNQANKKKKKDIFGSMLSGGMSGASTGAQAGGGWGALIGGVAGAGLGGISEYENSNRE